MKKIYIAPQVKEVKINTEHICDINTGSGVGVDTDPVTGELTPSAKDDVDDFFGW